MCKEAFTQVHGAGGKRMNMSPFSEVVGTTFQPRNADAGILPSKIAKKRKFAYLRCCFSIVVRFYEWSRGFFQHSVCVG